MCNNDDEEKKMSRPLLCITIVIFFLSLFLTILLMLLCDNDNDPCSIFTLFLFGCSSKMSCTFYIFTQAHVRKKSSKTTAASESHETDRKIFISPTVFHWWGLLMVRRDWSRGFYLCISIEIIAVNFSVFKNTFSLLNVIRSPTFQELCGKVAFFSQQQ